MRFAASETPQEIGIDGTEEQVARKCPFPGAVDMIKDPLQLGTGEIGIQQQAGFSRDRGFEASFAELFTKIGSAPVLPDNRIVYGLTGNPVPDQRGFTLIRYADCDDILCPNACLLYTSPSPRDLSTSRMPSSA